MNMLPRTSSRRDVFFFVLFLFVAAMLAGKPAHGDGARTDVASLNFLVGDVARSRGEVSAVTDLSVRTLTRGSGVIFRDRILTGSESRAEISLIDDSVIWLGDHSDLVVDEMVFDPTGRSGARPRGVVQLFQGVFRMVSGKVNKVPHGSLTLETPMASIGIRGTDFWGLQQADKLTVVLIDHGELDVSNGSDSVTLSEPLTGVVLRRGAAEIERIRITPRELSEAKRTVAF
jgi:hypothetical protein